MERVRHFFCNPGRYADWHGGNRVPFAVKSGSRQLFIRHRFIYHCGVSAASVYREGWLHALQQACVSH